MSASLLFSLWFAFSSIAQPQTLPVTPRQEREAEQQAVERQASALPQVKAQTIEQAVRFSVEQNNLVVSTSLPDDTSRSRIEIPGLKGITTLRWFDEITAAKPRRQDFSLTVRDLSDPANIDIGTSVSFVVSRVLISRDIETDDWFTSIQLLQDGPRSEGLNQQEYPVRFYIHRETHGNDAKEINLKIQTLDFARLLSEHRAELDEYLRPIIRDFKQERHVFSIPPAMAWQVLGSDLPDDPSVRKQVEALIGKLGEDDFRQREQAMQELKSIGLPAARVIARIDRAQLSTQQNSQIDTFLAEFAPLTAQQVKTLAEDKGFLLDVLFSEDRPLRELALRQLKTLAGDSVILNQADSAAEREEAIAALRAKLVPATQPSP